jgi:hypothetical protein
MHAYLTSQEGQVRHESIIDRACVRSSPVICPIRLLASWRCRLLVFQRRVLRRRRPASLAHSRDRSGRPAAVRLKPASVATHEYKIGRVEARDLGLKAIDASPELDAALWKLFESYESAMELRKPINPATAFQPGEAKATLQDLALAYLESTVQTDPYRFDIELNRPIAPAPPGQPQQFGPQVQVTITRQEWVQE